MPTSGSKGMRSVSSRSGREVLQRELGDVGQVLPYMFRGVGECKAAGWYARVDGKLLFLGGHLAIACAGVIKIREARA